MGGDGARLMGGTGWCCWMMTHSRRMIWKSVGICRVTATEAEMMSVTFMLKRKPPVLRMLPSSCAKGGAERESRGGGGIEREVSGGESRLVKQGSGGGGETGIPGRDGRAPYLSHVGDAVEQAHGQGHGDADRVAHHLPAAAGQAQRAGLRQEGMAGERPRVDMRVVDRLWHTHWPA